MGKIFDALEKAEKRASGLKPVLHAPDKPKAIAKNDMATNIVQLEAVNKKPLDDKLDPNLIAYYSPQSVEAELFKVLRTNILFPTNGTAPKLILVTSAMPGDGKSFVSANLAISMAQGVEEHVLLIDGDIRKPSIHRLFGHEKTMGLAEILSNGSDLANVLLKTPIPKLTILPGGEPPSNPSELLSSKKMKALLDEVMNRYEDRYIIIDSPPPAMAIETTAIAKIVQGVIVVVKAGKTPKQAVSDVIEQIGKEKILGIVLNNMDQSINKYYGYGKPYYKAT
jgi:exopolysaccharide/PEP-CTERM locus tyrosine autokinase